MPVNDLTTTIYGRTRTFLNFRRRQRLDFAPLRLVVLERRRVARVKDPLTDSLQRAARRTHIAFDLRDALLFGTQRVVLLFQDLVDAFVLVARQFQQPCELSGIFDALRRQLPYTAGRTLDDQRRHLQRITDRSQCVGQVRRIAA